MKPYSIIYCIDIYSGKSGNGASNALRGLILKNPCLGNYKLFCKTYVEGDLKDIVPTIETGKNVVDEFVRGSYQCIHWFRANGLELYAEIIQEIRIRKLKIPIISTICQQPTASGLFLTPIEVKYPSRIIFIDNTAYNNKYFRFIPELRRKMIRFGGWTIEGIKIYDEILNNEVLTNKKDERIVYGRGGTLNKCPHNMFEIFDKIAPPKKFVIVGSGPLKKWIQEEISKRKDYEIVLLDAMPRQAWLEIVSSFDIFLYHLPMDAYSSTDGTMMHAMWMRKPIVYYGPDAPKEFLKDGYNSKIALTEVDLVKCCNELATNKEERIRLGENARKTVNSFQSYEQFLDKMNQQYEDVTPLPPLRLSVNYLSAYAWYMYKQDKSWLLRMMKAPIDLLRVKMAIGTRCKKVFS